MSSLHVRKLAGVSLGASLGVLQGLQRAINAYVLRHGILDTIDVDGKIGSATLSTAQQIWAHGVEKKFAGWPSSPPTSATQLTRDVEVYSAAFSRAAGAIPDTTTEPGTKKSAGMGMWLLAGFAGVATYAALATRRR